MSSYVLPAAAAVLRRPRLWAVAAHELRVLAVPGWWRTWPPVPRPARSWVEFRAETQYGDKQAEPSPGDVVAWLEWCRTARQVARHGH